MPESIGDLHLKLISKYPGKFMIRKELVDNFFRAYYNLLWDKNNDSNQKLELIILNGDHMESAFVEVRLGKECLESKVAPLLANWDKKTNTSIFINHIDSVSIRRKQLADFFSEKVNHSLDEVDGKKMLERLKHHGNAFLDLFGSIAANGLPFYTISIS